MTMQQLIGFVSVSETRNYSQSAKKLYLTQPALSNQIKSLEEELGYKLFKRTSNGIELTEAGETFLVEAQYMISHYEKAKKNLYFTHKLGQQKLHMGYSDYDIWRPFVPILSELKSMYPELQMDVKKNDRKDLLDALKDEELDFVVTYMLDEEQDSSVEFKSLFSTHDNFSLMLAVQQDHPLAKKDSVSIYDLHENDVLWIDAGLGVDVFEFQEKTGISLEGVTIKDCPSLRDALMLVESGFGFTILPEFIIPKNSPLKFIRFMDMPEASFGFCYRKDCSELVKDLVKLCNKL